MKSTGEAMIIGASYEEMMEKVDGTSEKNIYPLAKGTRSER